MSESTIDFGDTARDTITGLEGVVVCKTQWIHGCLRIGLQPREVKDGKPVEATYFDEPQLVLVSKVEGRKVDTSTPQTASKPGGPRPSPERRADPGR